MVSLSLILSEYDMFEFMGQPDGPFRPIFFDRFSLRGGIDRDQFKPERFLNQDITGAEIALNQDMIQRLA